MKHFYTWEQFEKDTQKIAEWARDKSFRNVYGIPRGGLVIAVALSNRLKLPLILKAEEITEATLVVDDISDTGKTLAKLEMAIGFKPRVASVFIEKNTAWMPEFWVSEKMGWVVFPWETEESSKYDDTAF